ncbi:MAG: Ig-like domain-containing protein, partial [Limisphaerales bacterium]
GWATAISAGATGEFEQTLTFVVTNDNSALFAIQPVISADGTLTFAPAANATGTATVSVVLKDDGGTGNGGQDTSAVQTFRIEVVRTKAPRIGGISWDQGQLRVRWEDGHLLQWAPELAGPWEDLPQATSPFTLTPEGHHRFYRLQAPEGR